VPPGSGFRSSIRAGDFRDHPPKVWSFVTCSGWHGSAPNYWQQQ
jgi:hypothetical protein